jgi:hypothetical protein
MYSFSFGFFNYSFGLKSNILHILKLYWKKMKRFTFVIIVVFSSNVLKAQEGRSFFDDESKGFRVVYYSPGAIVNIQPYEVFYYENEKIVNGNQVWCLVDFDVCRIDSIQGSASRIAYSDDWFSQKILAEYLKTISKDEFNRFVSIFIFSSTSIQKFERQIQKSE